MNSILYQITFILFSSFLVSSAFSQSNNVTLPSNFDSIVVTDEEIVDSGVKPFDVLDESDFELIQKNNISDSLDGSRYFFYKIWPKFF